MEKRSGINIQVKMKSPDKYNVEENIHIDLPWDIISESLEEYFNYKYDVDARGKNIWNMLVYLEQLSGCSNLIDSLIDDDEFNELVLDKYLESSAYEEDYEDWLEDVIDNYNWEHKLGDYAEDE